MERLINDVYKPKKGIEQEIIDIKFDDNVKTPINNSEYLTENHYIAATVNDAINNNVDTFDYLAKNLVNNNISYAEYVAEHVDKCIEYSEDYFMPSRDNFPSTCKNGDWNHNSGVSGSSGCVGTTGVSGSSGCVGTSGQSFLDSFTGCSRLNNIPDNLFGNNIGRTGLQIKDPSRDINLQMPYIHSLRE